MSIEVTNLSKHYGNQKAVDQLDFSLKHGEIVGLLGPNGAGKSTTMKMLTGYLFPSSGTAKVCGLNVAEDGIELRKNLGYLSEQNPLYVDMYVKEYLLHVSSFYKLKNRKKAVEQIIADTGLQTEQHKRIGALSKGFKQRVGLAQALIHDPKVLILDEPTSGLDPNQLDEIRALIKRIGKKKTVILSTHIMQEVEAICDRVIIINKGRLVLDSPIEDLRKQRKGKSTIEVKFSEKVAIKDILNLPEVTDASESEGVYTISSGKIGATLSQAVFDLAVRSDNKVLQIKEVSDSLEEIFRQMTKI